jgi:hypothetical protein
MLLENKRPHYLQAKEVDKAVLEERAINLYNVQREEEAARKREAQRKYREALDLQKQNRESMRVAGKMSRVERQLNKDDLLAYKFYDGNQYALVPGVSSHSKLLDRSKFVQGPSQTVPGSPSQIGGGGEESVVAGRPESKLDNSGPSRGGLLSRQPQRNFSTGAHQDELEGGRVQMDPAMR